MHHRLVREVAVGEHDLTHGLAAHQVTQMRLLDDRDAVGVGRPGQLGRIPAAGDLRDLRRGEGYDLVLGPRPEVGVERVEVPAARAQDDHACAIHDSMILHCRCWRVRRRGEEERFDTPTFRSSSSFGLERHAHFSGLDQLASRGMEELDTDWLSVLPVTENHTAGLLHCVDWRAIAEDQQKHISLRIISDSHLLHPSNTSRLCSSSI